MFLTYVITFNLYVLCYNISSVYLVDIMYLTQSINIHGSKSFVYYCIVVYSRLFTINGIKFIQPSPTQNSLEHLLRLTLTTLHCIHNNMNIKIEEEIINNNSCMHESLNLDN